MKLIDKSALVAEIERRKHKLLDHIICEGDKEWVVRTAHQLNRIIMFLDTLEVKEVDLKKELDSFAYSLPHSATGDGYHLGHFDDPRVIEAGDSGWTHSWKYKEVEKIAKHFFELGLKAQKGEEI